MTHAQTRMAAILNVALRTTETSDQEVAQAFFRGVEVMLRIQWAEDVVVAGPACRIRLSNDENLRRREPYKVLVPPRSRC